MEDGSQGSRRSRVPARPESSASSMTRMTPSSSNSSTTNLPRNTSVRAGNSLLQERLRERKVESARRDRRRSIDMPSDRDIQSSPVKGSLMRDERRPSSCGVSNKPMGVKQIEDQVSTLHKQNFDLKLELYHRRQRQEELETKLEARDAEYAELQDVNDQLLTELEKRDNAVNEAVKLICELEEKVERYERNREDVKAFDASYELAYFDHQHNSNNNPSSSPPIEKGILRPTRSVPRMPSFLSETTQNTENLRSLYMPSESYSDAGLPQLHEGLSDGANSPRLSVLSESSFVSIYGQKQLPLKDLDDEEPRRHRASSSIEKWVDDRPVPTISPALRPMPSSRKGQFLSINDVLESPLQRLEKLKHNLGQTNRGVQALERNPSIQEKRKSKELRKVFTDQGNFEDQQTLPPTPDTISTNTLRNYKNSNDTLAQDRMKEGTFLNSINAFPTPGETYNVFQSTLSVRPRSAGETITSRREGHGWDTTSEELTADLASISSNGTYSANPIRPPRVVTPDLFSFSSNEWGRDMMYNNEPELPAHITRARYQELRRSNLNSDPLTSETIHDSRYEEIPYGTVPIDTTPKPEVSDRRSSLSAVTKIRRSNNTSLHSTSTNSTQAVGAAITIAAPTYKNRFSSLGLFRRSETSPSPTTSSFPRAKPQGQGRERTQSYLDNTDTNLMEDDQARSTPPPIKRSRPSQAQSYRPSSAGAGMQCKMNGALEHVQAQMQEEQLKGRARRGSLNGGGGPPVTAVNVDDEGKVGGGGGGKKWFGLGRSGSQRR